MNKREFLKTSAILGAGTLIAPAVASSCMNCSAAGGATASLVATSGEGKFAQPELGYAFDALEPHIDAMTMELHYGKHHAGYTRKFNAALEHEDLHPTDIYKIFESVSNYGAGVRNNGGGYFNHNLYWKFMSPDGGGDPQENWPKPLPGILDHLRSSKNCFPPLLPVILARAGDGCSWMGRGNSR